MTRVEEYVQTVLDNPKEYNKYEKKAVQRHVRDISRDDFDYYYDEEAAEKAVGFIELLKHTKGKSAGQYFILSPWQVFIVSMIFGWKKKKDNLRRFRKAYVEVSRKNGKSTLGAAIALLMMLADGEVGAEIYSIATKEDQAKIVWDEAKRMIEATQLKQVVKRTYKTLYHLAKNSKYQPLGRDSDTLDGLSPSCVIVDEYHAHKDNELVNVMESGMGYREQPLTFIITTAGSSTNSPCYTERDRVKEILETDDDDLRDETTFGIIFTLDENDEWTDSTTWKKANPNLHIIQEDYIPNRVKEAISNPRIAVDVKTKNLNIWTNADDEWISVEKWDACKGRIPKNIIESECAGAIDLSLTDDLTAYVKVFEREGMYYIKPYFYMPKDTILDKTQRDKVPYLTWSEKGYITATPGPVIDYDYVEKDIAEDNEELQLREVAYDPYNARTLVDRLLDHGVQMVEFRQNKTNISEPTKEFERLVLQKKIVHDGNPVLSWMMQNVQIDTDAHGNIQPVKTDRYKRRRKIDGVVAAIMALDRIKASEEVQKTSIYEERGLLSIDI
jgi:phage terminase large subunit-like protein